MAESSPRYRFGREAQTEEQTEHGTGYEGRTQNHYRDSWPIGNIRPVSADFFDSERMSTMVGLHGEEEGRAGGNAAGSPSKEEEDEEKRKEPSVLLLLAIFLSVFLAAVDISIITTALPTMAEHMNTSQKGFAWIGSAYLLAGAASEPIWAKVSDIFGRRPILMCANAVFLGGSVMCALSKHLGALLTGRVVQGLGSGGLLVLSNILIADLYSPRRRGAYYGLLGLVWAIANASGPFLGGIFSEKLDWRWCFWVNVPLDVLAFVLTTFFLNVHTPHTPFWEGIKAIDWLGSLAVLGGTVMLLLGLEFGGIDYPWNSPVVVVLILCGLITWVGFFFIEAYIPKYPLIPLRIFDSVSNYAIFAIDFSHGFVFIAGSYFLPVYFQAVLGAKPLLSGIYLFPFVITLSFSAVATGFIINKTGAYLPLITFGMLFMTLGFALFIDLPSHFSWARIVIYQIIAGIGIGPNFQSPMLALQNSVAPHDIAPATSTFGFVRQLANSISVVVGGVLLQNQLKDRRFKLVEAGIETRVIDLITGGSASSSTMEIHMLPPQQRQVAQQAFSDSMQKMWIMYACVGIVGLGLTDFVKKRALREEHEETKTGLAEQERIRQDALQQRAVQRARRRVGVLPGVSEGDGPWEKNRLHVEINEISGKSAEVLGFNSPTAARSPITFSASDESHDTSRKPSITGMWKPPAHANSGATDAKSMYFIPELNGVQNGTPPPKPEGALRAARKRAGQRGTRSMDERGNWFDELSEMDTSEAQDGNYHRYWPDNAYSPENASIKSSEKGTDDQEEPLEVKELPSSDISNKTSEPARLSPVAYNAWVPDEAVDASKRNVI